MADWIIHFVGGPNDGQEARLASLTRYVETFTIDKNGMLTHKYRVKRLSTGFHAAVHDDMTDDEAIAKINREGFSRHHNGSGRANP